MTPGHARSSLDALHQRLGRARRPHPALTVPAGMLHGLPIGISFFAGAYSEATLLRMGYAYEQATKRRERPRFLPTADLGAG